MIGYNTLREQQQQEVNNFPLGFAFGNKQFKEMMSKWGLDADNESDLKKSISFIFGSIYLEKGYTCLQRDVPQTQ